MINFLSYIVFKCIFTKYKTKKLEQVVFNKYIFVENCILLFSSENLTDADFNVRAGKIVAGLEPENTNLLLQAIGKAIDSKVHSSEYVKKIQSPNGDTKSDENKISAKKTSTVTKKTNKTPKSKESVSKPSKAKVALNETPKSKIAATETPKSKRSTPKESPKESKPPKESKSPKENNIKSKKTQNEKQENKIPDQQILAEQITNGAIDEEKRELLESNKEDHNEKGDNAENELNKTDEQISPENKELLQNIESNQESKPNVPLKEDSEIVKADMSIPKNTTIRPKSARPKSGEKDKIKPDELKPLEMKGKCEVPRSHILIYSL